jgi:hypothetical protein
VCARSSQHRPAAPKLAFETFARATAGNLDEIDLLSEHRANRLELLEIHDI